MSMRSNITLGVQNLDLLLTYFKALMYSDFTLIASCFKLPSYFVTATRSANSAIPFFIPLVKD